ncbi:MAG: CoA pyrophosphatase [Chitinophagales bacterium]
MQITSISEALLRPLPGQAAQLQMAPPYREPMDMQLILQRQPRLGGVLLLLVEKEKNLEIVFTRRMEYAGVHSGQISFPGGKQEPDDIDLTATALRETQEEIGVDPSMLQVLGRLSELYIPPSNFLVYPSVAYASQPLEFKAQEREVREIFTIPVHFFLQPENRRTTMIPFANGNTLEVPAFIFGDAVIWGATAIILSEFVAVLQS